MRTSFTKEPCCNVDFPGVGGGRELLACSLRFNLPSLTLHLACCYLVEEIYAAFWNKYVYRAYTHSAFPSSLNL